MPDDPKPGEPPRPLRFPSARRWQRERRPPILMATVELQGELRELARGSPGPFVHLPGALQSMMTARSLTQAELSRRTGVPAPKISEYLSGRTEPTISTLGRLLEGMDATVRELAEAMERRADEAPYLEG